MCNIHYISDPTVASFVIDTADQVFQQDVPLNVDVTVQISNSATGTYDDIKATSGDNYNFAFELQLTNKDLQTDATADTSIPAATPTFTDDALRQSALAKSKNEMGDMNTE